MTGEFNDLSTNNIGVSFSNNTNNTALSDELSASSNYVKQMGTAYSAGKWAKKILVVTGITLTVSAAAILGGNYIKNVFIGDVPVLADDHVFKLEENIFNYSFAITENKNNYPVMFRVYEDVRKPLFTLDCSISQSYEGTVEIDDIQKNYKYEIFFTNRLDYRRTLVKGNVSDVLEE